MDWNLKILTIFFKFFKTCLDQIAKKCNMVCLIPANKKLDCELEISITHRKWTIYWRFIHLLILALSNNFKAVTNLFCWCLFRTWGVFPRGWQWCSQCVSYCEIHVNLKISHIEDQKQKICAMKSSNITKRLNSLIFLLSTINAILATLRIFSLSLELKTNKIKW